MTSVVANFTRPRVIVFAGPNGAGKSTHAEVILDALGIATFVNADHIARGLSGRHADTVAFEAGRIMLNRLRRLADTQSDFAFESTLSSRSFAPLLRHWKSLGYLVAIYYFSLSSAQLAIRRVKLRVALGGHDVPADVVERRFTRSLHNFLTLYSPLVDQWTLFDNSYRGQACPVAAFNAPHLTILDTALWNKLQKFRQDR